MFDKKELAQKDILRYIGSYNFALGVIFGDLKEWNIYVFLIILLNIRRRNIRAGYDVLTGIYFIFPLFMSVSKILFSRCSRLTETG